MTDHVVIDSTCLIALERIDQLPLIPQIFPSILVPPGVQSEFGTPLNWLTIQPVKNIMVVEALKTQIDDGEAQAIALALELESALLILDDKKARRVAQQLGLKVIGTIGITDKGQAARRDSGNSSVTHCPGESEFPTDPCSPPRSVTALR